MENILLLLHPVFGGLATLAALWVFVDTLNAGESSVARIRNVSLFVAILMWLTYFLGGYFYIVYYGVDKAFIKGGPWAFGHNFFMEVKEHVFLMLLLLATYLPIAASGYLPSNKPVRKVILWVTGLIVPTSLAMEGSGAIISVAVKIALLLKMKGI
ncbi:MAG: hypothetical protein A2V65_07100 [Deltaproteobacteria bacterium RBG_13_49_15]|nr:MAG: hypothetical protein A2V65_07100 [Deltaproteobacteria bacterium RBG_13_49_15]